MLIEYIPKHRKLSVALIVAIAVASSIVLSFGQDSGKSLIARTTQDLNLREIQGPWIILNSKTHQADFTEDIGEPVLVLDDLVYLFTDQSVMTIRLTNIQIRLEENKLTATAIIKKGNKTFPGEIPCEIGIATGSDTTVSENHATIIRFHLKGSFAGEEIDDELLIRKLEQEEGARKVSTKLKQILTGPETQEPKMLEKINRWIFETKSR